MAQGARHSAAIPTQNKTLIFILVPILSPFSRGKLPRRSQWTLLPRCYFSAKSITVKPDKFCNPLQELAIPALVGSTTIKGNQRSSSHVLFSSPFALVSKHEYGPTI